MGSLFLTSLLSLVDDYGEHEYGEVIVSREVSSAQGRIDIVVETQGQIIGIENKIYHALVNDLEDYSTALENLASAQQKAETKKIVLSIQMKKMSKPNVPDSSV